MSAEGTDVGSYASAEATAGWARGAAERAQYLGAITETMLDMAAIKRGSRVLDVAAGTGEQSIRAAERVGPDGYVLATDVASRMLEVAVDTARAAGYTNVETRVMDARTMQLPEDFFDSAICRMSLMLLPERPRVMAAIYRALKSGGRFAAVVLSTPERNPYSSGPMAIAQRFVRIEPRGEPDPGFFALSDPVVLHRCFEEAGFVDVTVVPVVTHRTFPSVAAAVQDRRDSLPEVTELLAGTSDDVRQQAWTEITSAVSTFLTSHQVTVPGELLIAAGRK